jgi:hypothetical protein
VPHFLHVQGGVEEQGEEAAEGDQLGEVRREQALDPQDRERQQRVGGSPFVDDERSEHDSGSAQGGDGLDRSPPDYRCPHQAVDEQQHAAGDQRGPLSVEG